MVDRHRNIETGRWPDGTLHKVKKTSDWWIDTKIYINTEFENHMSESSFHI